MGYFGKKTKKKLAPHAWNDVWFVVFIESKRLKYKQQIQMAHLMVKKESKRLIELICATFVLDHPD